MAALRAGGGAGKKAPGGRRKCLKALDSDKEIKVNSFDFLWPGLAGFGQIWENLGLALRKPN